MHNKNIIYYYFIIYEWVLKIYTSKPVRKKRIFYNIRPSERNQSEYSLSEHSFLNFNLIFTNIMYLNHEMDTCVCAGM